MLDELAGILMAKGETLSTAESCTGGLLAGCLTDIPGASAWFMGGIVAYDNSIKERILGVSPLTLTTHGAVSEETAREMATGALRLFKTDWVVSVTGIAGPSGGSPEKPVGLVYIAIAGSGGVYARKYLFQPPGSRADVRRKTMEAALTLLQDKLTASPAS